MPRDPFPTLIVGLAAEARIARRIGWSVAIGGGSAAGATMAAERAVAAGAPALVSLGLAGGLDPALPPGAVLVPDSVLMHGDIFPTDEALRDRLGGGTGHSILAESAVVATVTAKRHLRASTGAAAVDLESGPVALVAAAHDLPFAVLRAVCDPADRDLPPAALLALNEAGAIGLRRIAASVWRHPGQLRGLLRLAADAAAARRALLRHVARLARQR
jgi:adenosylhomocysteine nucleosidase